MGPCMEGWSPGDLRTRHTVRVAHDGQSTGNHPGQTYQDGRQRERLNATYCEADRSEMVLVPEGRPLQARRCHRKGNVKRYAR